MRTAHAVWPGLVLRMQQLSGRCRLVAQTESDGCGVTVEATLTEQRQRL